MTELIYCHIKIVFILNTNIFLNYKLPVYLHHAYQTQLIVLQEVLDELKYLNAKYNDSLKHQIPIFFLLSMNTKAQPRPKHQPRVSALSARTLLCSRAWAVTFPYK